MTIDREDPTPVRRRRSTRDPAVRDSDKENAAVGKSGKTARASRKAAEAGTPAAEAQATATGETKSISGKSRRAKPASEAPPPPSATTATPDASQSPGAADFGVMAENMADLVDQGRKALAAAIGGIDAGDTRSELAASVADATRTLGAVAEYWLAKPDRAAAAQAELYGGLSEIWRQTLLRYSGEETPPVVPPDPADRRFAAPEWQESPFFDWLRQSYLFASRWVGDLIDKTESLDPHTRTRAAFYTRLISSAVSPSNFVPTNPELLRATMEARGENLVRGFRMLAEDISAGHGVLKIRQTDEEKFALGVNMANTPGKVVWRNDVMELIQYTPTTGEVFARPLLITPPWINKFYVLDLNREKSFVRWAVEQGLTVFIISWVNPDETKAEKGFEAYMHEGVLTALDVIQKITGEKKIAAAGYCVGGTLLAVTLAYMSATGDDRIDSVTFFATQVDFSEAGELQIFFDEQRVAALDESMARTGYLEGVKMANAFNMLRPNELIWTYVVDNYMKGVEPAAFDLLAWNSDCTRIPRANHSFYIHSCYLENRLARGEMIMDGVRLDLGRVKIPVYELATREDHIAPAPSVFRGAKLYGGDVTFVLGGAGHIAGVINPPGKGKYQYWTNGPVVGDYENWIAGAKETAGSWWPDWLAWISAQAPRKVPARPPGGGGVEPLCDAPGEYVRVKS
jgi:polyhydroxyalkanoate synthase